MNNIFFAIDDNREIVQSLTSLINMAGCFFNRLISGVKMVTDRFASNPTKSRHFFMASKHPDLDLYDRVLLRRISREFSKKAEKEAKKS